MWFRIFLGSWSLIFLAFFVWLASHQSEEGFIFGRYSFPYFVLLLIVAILVLMSLFAQCRFFYVRLYSLRREIVLVIVSIGATLVATEISIELIDPLGISYFREATHYHLDKIADSTRVFKHRPGLQRIYQGVDVSINEHGFRDRSLEVKQKNEMRVLLLGDSVTFGWGVPEEDTFSRKLEAMLTNHWKRPVRTVNTGVGGYNTVQEYATLITFAGDIDPDVVILLYVLNDVEVNDPPFDPWSARALKGKSPPETLDIILRKRWLYRLGYFGFNWVFSRQAQALDKNGRGFKESVEALGAIATFCQERHIRFVTFFYRPKEPASVKASFSDQLFGEVRDVGIEHDFPVLDIEPWWKGRNMREVTNSVVDSHPNKLGHEVLAKGMADFLLKQGLAP